MNDDDVYRVVRNDEEQYSIWRAGLDLPAGWTAEGTSGSKQECLDHIGRIWTDMRPRSLRDRAIVALPCPSAISSSTRICRAVSAEADTV